MVNDRGKTAEQRSFIEDGKEIYGHEREPQVGNPQNFPPSASGGIKDDTPGGDSKEGDDK